MPMRPNRALTSLLSVAAFVLSGAAHSLSAQARITVGVNVQVSVAHRDHQHTEFQIAGHPTDPNVLVACSIRMTTERIFPFEGPVVLYHSRDGGKSWAATHEF